VTDDNLGIDELEDQEAEPATKAKPKKKERAPGLFSRLGQRITAPVAKRKPSELWNARIIGILVLAALIVWLLAVNLGPVRIVLFFWTVDMPKTVGFLLDVALGALLMWLWLRRKSAKKPAEGEGAK
jgi:uncharacterized integral membrane protein